MRRLLVDIIAWRIVGDGILIDLPQILFKLGLLQVARSERDMVGGAEQRWVHRLAQRLLLDHKGFPEVLLNRRQVHGALDGRVVVRQGQRDLVDKALAHRIAQEAVKDRHTQADKLQSFVSPNILLDRISNGRGRRGR